MNVSFKKYLFFLKKTMANSQLRKQNGCQTALPVSPTLRFSVLALTGTDLDCRTLQQNPGADPEAEKIYIK